MSERVKSGALYEDLIAAPDDKIAEIVGGDLYLSPRPSMRHSNVVSVLGGQINQAFHRPGGWWILFEPEVYVYGDVLVPDLAGWRRERLPDIPDGSGTDVAPDWVCEVLSPSTERFDRQQKLPRYAFAKVAHLWLVDPPRRRLMVYGRADDDWVLLEEYSGSDTVSAPPFESVTIELASLWAD